MDDDRQEHAAAHDQVAAQGQVTARGKAGPAIVVALGDSTTSAVRWDGWDFAVWVTLLPAALEPLGVRARVVDAGIADTTTRDAVARLDRDVRIHAPDLVVVQFGINDSWIDADQGAREPRLTREELRGNLKWIVSALKADGVAVLLMTPNPMRWTDPLWVDVFDKAPGLLDTRSERGLDALLDLYADDVRRVAREEAVPLVDVHRAFEEYGEQQGRSVLDLLLDGDGIHPGAAGHRFVCGLLAPRVAELLRARQA